MEISHKRYERQLLVDKTPYFSIICLLASLIQVIAGLANCIILIIVKHSQMYETVRLNVMEQKRNNLNRQSSLSDADITVLSRVPLFQGMTPDKILGLLEHAYTMQANRNTLLFLQDDDADKFLAGWQKNNPEQAQEMREFIASIEIEYKESCRS